MLKDIDVKTLTTAVNLPYTGSLKELYVREVLKVMI